MHSYDCICRTRRFTVINFDVTGKFYKTFYFNSVYFLSHTKQTKMVLECYFLMLITLDLGSATQCPNDICKEEVISKDRSMEFSFSKQT